jgi:hypothetical protein
MITRLTAGDRPAKFASDKFKWQRMRKAASVLLHHAPTLTAAILRADFRDQVSK